MDIGKFTTIGFIGSGNFGTVVRAKDTLLDVERAVKIIQAKDPQEFMDAINEAQILERCRHNHIVDIKEIGIYDVKGVNSPCIITEYLKNGSAQGYIEKQFVTPHFAVKVVSECLFALEHAHTQGILHRDIKPGNILFGDNWQAKLSDFGLAYGLAHQAFDFAGYSSHLPPEVLEGSAQDELSDLYSMGVTFHRLLNNMPTLDVPFANDVEWLKAVEREKFPVRNYMSHIPDQIVRVVRKSIKANRNDRYQNCLQFRQALQKITLTVEWKPIDKDNWVGKFKGNEFLLTIYKKRTGYCIDFKRNGRKDNSRSYTNIPSETEARNEFFKLIRETTLKL